MVGSWEIKEGKIYITYSYMGLTAQGTISGDTMAFNDGSIWKKEPTV
jgi:hypothetical protein